MSIGSIQRRVGRLKSVLVSAPLSNTNARMTEEYTVVQLRRQEELTRRIQAKRTKAGKRSNGKVVEIKNAGTAT